MAWRSTAKSEPPGGSEVRELEDSAPPCIEGGEADAFRRGAEPKLFERTTFWHSPAGVDSSTSARRSDAPHP